MADHNHLNENVVPAVNNEPSCSQSVTNPRRLNPQQNEPNENQVGSDRDSEATIKKRNDNVDTDRQMVVNSNIKSVQIHSAYQRKMWLQNFPISTFVDRYKQQEMGNDPLTLLPEEVWAIFLFQVKDVKDLLSLSQTCLLFQEILNKTKNEWLFVKVFPYLFNYLSRNDLLRCRLVCKQWVASVDNFLENYHKTIFHLNKPVTMLDILEQPKIYFRRYRFDYGFLIPFNDNLSNETYADDDVSSNDAMSVISSSRSTQIRFKNKIIEAMKQYATERNPFIGRSVTIFEEPLFEISFEENLQQFVPQSKYILESFGKHIWHLSINCDGGTQSPLDFWRVLNCGLKECKNLKSLRIYGRLDSELGWGFLTNTSEPLVDIPSLEMVKMDMENNNLVYVQDKLVSKFSKQLKRFEVKIWRVGMYYSADWDNLLELQIHKGNCQLIVEGLMKTVKMGNLTKLTIPINLCGNWKILEGVVGLTRKFSKLSALVLKFEDTFEGTPSALDKVCEERLPPGVVGSENLTSLEIHSKSSKLVTYDFLVYFPYLSWITINHCHDRRVCSGTGLGLTRETVGHVGIKEGKGILNICKYMAALTDDATDKDDSRRKIYGKANIWGLLPFLKSFTVFSETWLIYKNKSVFTRSEYEYFVSKGRQL